jgi:hypothetical protein
MWTSDLFMKRVQGKRKVDVNVSWMSWVILMYLAEWKEYCTGYVREAEEAREAIKRSCGRF